MSLINSWISICPSPSRSPFLNSVSTSDEETTLPPATDMSCFISSLSITPSPLVSNLLKAVLASDTLPKVIPTEEYEVTDEKEVEEEVDWNVDTEWD